MVAGNSDTEVPRQGLDDAVFAPKDQTYRDHVARPVFWVARPPLWLKGARVG